MIARMIDIIVYYIIYYMGVDGLLLRHRFERERRSFHIWRYTSFPT